MSKLKSVDLDKEETPTVNLHAFDETLVMEKIFQHTEQIKILQTKIKSANRTNKLLLETVESLIRVLCGESVKIERGMLGWKPLSFERLEEQVVALREEIAKNEAEGIPPSLLVMRFLNQEVPQKPKGLIAKLKEAIEIVRQ